MKAAGAMKFSTVLTILFLASPGVLSAEDLEPAALFSDHVVLQRDQAAPVWGWGAPG